MYSDQFTDPDYHERENKSAEYERKLDALENQQFYFRFLLGQICFWPFFYALVTFASTPAEKILVIYGCNIVGIPLLLFTIYKLYKSCK